MENQAQIKEILGNAKYPHYRRTICHVFKVISPDTCITINMYGGYESIATDSAKIAYLSESYHCTGLEYELTFKKVLDVLKSK